MRGSDIRSQFIDFFRQRGHAAVSSSPLVPASDPTLLFTNAGMVQFKDHFLGLTKPPYARAVTAQKCVRAGGKHNDLDEVGKTARHHTFFEMLGNFSFGDYFKRDAILLSWELLTRVFGLEPGRLWPTVHHSDDEAAQLWVELTPVSADRVVRLGDKDNFWAMGDTGPCGPCSELIYDRGSSHACGDNCGIGRCDCDRWLELWNLVFMQYDRDSDGNVSPLPHPSIDTGMGLERIASVLQGVDSNYDTDLFGPLIRELESMSGLTYDRGRAGMPFRVVADHVRCCCFLLADGVVPGNEGRSYVLRRILRRAARYGKELGLDRPLLHTMVDPVVSIMGGAYPELVESAQRLAGIIRSEELRFSETLHEGTRHAAQLLDRAAAMGTVLPGQDAFLLYDTYGFPIDLARDMAEERGMTVDESGFEQAMAEQRARARQVTAGDEPDLPAELAGTHTEFVGEDSTADLAVDCGVVAVARDDADDSLLVTLDRTPFYAEGGGQVADVGTVAGDGGTAAVTGVRRVRETVVHRLHVESGTIRAGMRVRACVDSDRRRRIAAHHTATHLLHLALRQVIGEHAVQAGSMVDPDRLRFDYSHFEAPDSCTIDRIEAVVNDLIASDLDVRAEIMSLDQARRSGAMALFGEKYGDTVRVVEIGGISRELCGGTHVRRTGTLGLFLILSEGSIGSGMRRVEAVAGRAAHDYARSARELVRECAAALRCREDEIIGRIGELQNDIRRLERETERLTARLAHGSLDQLLSGAIRVGDVDVIAGLVGVADADALRSLIDAVRDRISCGVVILGVRTGDRAQLVCGATPSAVSRGVHCGRLVSELAKMVGGGGGGRPDMAQAGGKDPSRLDQAIAHAVEMVRAQLTTGDGGGNSGNRGETR